MTQKPISIWHAFAEKRGQFAADFLGVVVARDMGDATETARFLWGESEPNIQIVPTWKSTQNYKDHAA